MNKNIGLLYFGDCKLERFLGSGRGQAGHIGTLRRREGNAVDFYLTACTSRE